MVGGIIVKSGNNLSGKKIIEAVHRGKKRAVSNGIVRTLAKLLGDVAFKEGHLSKSVEESYTEQIPESGEPTLTIKFDRDTIDVKVASKSKGSDYSVFHINPGGTFSHYDDPTTTGTRPINEFEWNETIADEIERLIPNELRKEGLIITETF